MATEFSAQYYLDMSDEEVQAEADKFNIDTHGMSRNQRADAIYNAELRRRSEEENRLRQEKAQRQAELDRQALRASTRPGAAVQDEQVEEPDQPDYEAMTVAELRELAEERGVDLSDANRKGEIVQALRDADQADEGIKG